MPGAVKKKRIWQRIEPVRGDHIRVRRFLYYHHGVYISDKEVIHFNTPGKGDGLLGDAEVIATSLKEFLELGLCEVRQYNSSLLEKSLPTDTVVKRARSRLGESGYSIVFNNCEHFARWCKVGIHRSIQAENVALFILKLFLKKVC